MLLENVKAARREGGLVVHKQCRAARRPAYRVGCPTCTRPPRRCAARLRSPPAPSPHAQPSKVRCNRQRSRPRAPRGSALDGPELPFFDCACWCRHARASGATRLPAPRSNRRAERLGQTRAVNPVFPGLRWLQAAKPADGMLPACGVIAPHAGYSYSVRAAVPLPSGPLHSCALA